MSKSFSGNVAFLVQRIGPYHHARLLALAKVVGVRFVAIEYRPQESVYAWGSVAAESSSYAREQVESPQELLGALGKSCPTVVVCVGYADPEIHLAMDWALSKGVRLVTCSDSTFADEPRVWVKEASKRRLLAAFDAALVAGHRSRGYLGHLGQASRNCFQPWDVVDNAHFEDGAQNVRGNEPDKRRQRGLPDNYFLCVARFVQKKNIDRLLAAYRLYSAKVGDDGWDLVLAGSGPLEFELRTLAAAQGVGGKVFFAGLIGYGELPAFYGLAGAFVIPSSSDQWGLVVNEAMAAGLPVLVSSRCGCAPDLVREGENGFTFDPENIEQMGDRMLQFHHLDPALRRAMGQRSREIIADYSPEAFARGLNAAITHAFEEKPRRKGMLTRLAVRVLAGRKP